MALFSGVARWGMGGGEREMGTWGAMMLRIWTAILVEPHSKGSKQNENIVFADDLKAWLKAKRVTVSQMATADAAAHHNALIRELLQEIENAEKEG